MKYDICCIGHITLDKVVTPTSTVHMPGGTAFYFSSAIHQLGCPYTLLTAVAETELPYVHALTEQGIHVTTIPSQHTVYFENSYSDNQDHRTQRVLQTAVPFSVEDVEDLEATIFHLGPLLNKDIPVEVIQHLSTKGLISVDAQGYLRTVRYQKVYYSDWLEKKQALPYIHILKANEFELEGLTGTSNIRDGIKMLADQGVQELVITLGSKGSILFKDGLFYSVPAYTPQQTVDATGCGDTYMAGYLFKKMLGADLYSSGCFAAAMSTLKIENHGPFSGRFSDIEYVQQHAAVYCIYESY